MPRTRARRRSRAHVLDELDYKILLRLQANGRESNAEIARFLDVSEGTIRRRIKRLVDDEVIRVTAVPNPWKIGFEAVALIGLQVELDKMDQVANKLAEMKETHFVALTTGTYDIFVWVLVPTAEDLGNFIKTKLAGIAGVTRSETFINLEIRKRTYGWLS